MNDVIKVLMVDDEDQFRATTEKLLIKKGFSPILAASGEEAIDKLAQHPNVVVLDIKMPGMDGHATLKEIKKRTPDLPVIMLTGHGARPSARQARIEGAFDYLSKPCDINILAARIKDAANPDRDTDPSREKRVSEVMVPIRDYTIVNATETVRCAVATLKTSFNTGDSTSRLMETGHRSVLVMDSNQRVAGLLTIVDLLTALLPAYLYAPKPSTADSVQYSSMFWRGMFTQAVKEKSDMPIAEIMSPAPLAIDGQASLMEAAHMMVEKKERRLVVYILEKAAGIIREQDLFFEIERIMGD